MKKTVRRSVDQNSLMWQRLTDWMEQKPNRTLGGEPFTLHDYKEWLMAGFKKEVRLAHGINGGVVYLSRSTSGLTKDQFGQFLEFIAAEGTKRGVIFRDAPPDPIGSPRVRFRPDGLPEPPHNENELRAALKASVEECAQVVLKNDGPYEIVQAIRELKDKNV